MKKIYCIGKETPKEIGFAEKFTVSGHEIPKLYTTKKEALRALRWLEDHDDMSSFEILSYDKNYFEYSGDDDILEVILKMIFK